MLKFHLIAKLLTLVASVALWVTSIPNFLFVTRASILLVGVLDEIKKWPKSDSVSVVQDGFVKAKSNLSV